MSSYKHDMTGEHFGRLTVLRYAGKAPNGHSRWLCQCACGQITTVTRSNLIAGRQVSCGCKRQEQASQMNYIHGGRRTRLYSIWSNMITRTENPNGTAYHRYGGRGIKVCSEWRDSFPIFRAWALAHGYRDGLTLERIDNDGGYSPDNCRWATWQEQFNHRCDTHYITFDGKTQSLTRWARERALPPSALFQRVYAGWNAQRALTTPLGGDK